MIDSIEKEFEGWALSGCIFFVSLATLSLEIALTRLFSVSQWYHFAFMVVSIAFLGFGASGTLLMVVPSLLVPRPLPLLKLTTLLFAVSITASFAAANRLPFDFLIVFTDPLQLLYILIYYILLSIPFLLSGLTISIAITSFPKRVGSIYFSSLTGSGLGCIIVLAGFPFRGSGGIILMCSISGIIASLFLWNANRKINPLALVLLLVFGALLFKAPPFLNVRISPYKALAASLRPPGARHLETKWSATSRVDLVESPAVRFAPGLSLTYLGTLPEQVGLTVDAGSLNAITRFTGIKEELGFITQLPSSLPYYLGTRENVLILEPMGGLDILAAHYFGAKRIVAIERNPLVVEAVNERFEEFSGGIYSGRLRGLRLHVDEPRRFLRQEKEKFDAIFIPVTDIFSAQSTGIYGLVEDYGFTREAMVDYLSRLVPNGILSITRYLLPPPRETPRIVATLLDAMESLGIDNPQDRIVIIRSFGTISIFVKGSSIDKKDISKIRKFCNSRRFDVVFYPGIRSSEANRFNRFKRPVYHDLFVRMMNKQTREYLFRTYMFDIRPVTDDRPFFYHFYRWSKIKEIYRSAGNKWQPLIEGGYIIPIILVQAIFASLVLVLLPLLFTGKATDAERSSGGICRHLLYFLWIGAGYMFIEISLIQKSMLYLGKPVYAFSFVIFTLLVFSGIGSRLSEKMKTRKAPVLWVSAGVWALYAILPAIFKASLSQPLFVRGLFIVLALAPLGILMGMPFPVGIRQLERLAKGYIPWAWSINGCASVVSSVLVVLVALSFGFSISLLIGSAFYLLAFLCAKNEP